MKAFDDIVAHIDKCSGAENEQHPYYFFEPWDVEQRSDFIKEIAKKDGIDLYSEQIADHLGSDPHPFQSGYLLDDYFIKALLAGTSVGKSYCALIGIIMELTGEFPICFRHPKGKDTGVKRIINSDNISRFGRRDKLTGKLIDYKQTMEGANYEWDCGNIIGVGEFPKHMVAQEGSEVWLGTYMKAMNEYWWPRLSEKANLIIPEHLIDKSRGNNGYSQKNNVVYLIRDTKIAIITYESGYQRFEAQRVHRVVFDEEPTDEKIYQAGLQHCKYLSLVMTPYNGLTYTRKIMFPERKSNDVKVYHATQYDSPYQSIKGITIKRQSMNVWDIGARVWGFHTEASGKPYFDRAKINLWINRYSKREMTKTVEFFATKPFFGITPNYDVSTLEGLMEVPVKSRPVNEGWVIYEDVKPNVPYLYTGDTAEGSDIKEEVGDNNAGYVTRAYTMQERQEKNLKEGVLFKIVASRRTGIKTEDFAKESLLACRYYNNALMATETKRGFSNATYLSVTKDWPYWYKHISINDATRTPKESIGFDTNVATRFSLFDMIREYIGLFSEDEYPDIPDANLLAELSGAIVGKNGRCDHERSRGSLDNAVAYGIAFYVWKNAPEQVTFNGEYYEEEKKRNRRTQVVQHKSIMPMMGYRI